MKSALDILRDVFGYEGFREGQKPVVQAALKGRDAMVLLPTGSGKSICYQVPALVFARKRKSPKLKGMTIVVSPLIALMHDQVSTLRGKGVKAEALHSQIALGDQRTINERCRAGDVELLYISPERAKNAYFRRELAHWKIALLAIDEAHCVSQWGHDFRPDYMHISELRESVKCPVLALTATATDLVVDEIIAQLGLEDPAVIRTDLRRPNLSFVVAHLAKQDAKLKALASELDRANLRGRSAQGRGIVYCATRKKTEMVAKSLKTQGFSAGHYHGGRTQLARERAQKSFETGKTRILVATNAFGMGIDIPDIRMIAHFQVPGSVEAYYQEAGRAGRDGDPSRCILFFSPADLITQQRLAQSGSIAQQKRSDQALKSIQDFANSDRCRQVQICEYFCDGVAYDDCGHCDRCRNDDETAYDEFETPARECSELSEDEYTSIVEAVDRLNKPVGKTNLAKALRGSQAKSISKGGLLMLPEFGTLKHHDEASVVAAVERLLVDERLVKTGVKYPTVWIPGKPIRAKLSPVPRGSAHVSTAGMAFPKTTDMVRSLDNYRKRRARQLKWKTYMIFQRSVMLEIKKHEPTTMDDLRRIPGLGPVKIDRFGQDILDIVREHI